MRHLVFLIALIKIVVPATRRQQALCRLQVGLRSARRIEGVKELFVERITTFWRVLGNYFPAAQDLEQRKKPSLSRQVSRMQLSIEGHHISQVASRNITQSEDTEIFGLQHSKQFFIKKFRRAARSWKTLCRFQTSADLALCPRLRKKRKVRRVSRWVRPTNRNAGYVSQK